MEQSDRLIRSMLLDFYGELLTERQRECYDLHYNEDYSLSEIAEQSDISRQGVWDNIRRAEISLNEIEEKTGLVHRFLEVSTALEILEADFNELRVSLPPDYIEKTDKALKDLSELKEKVK